MDDIIAILQRTYDWKERVARDIDLVESGLVELIIPTREEARTLQSQCWICGSTNNLCLHHPAGRKHDYRTVTVCKDCHDRLSEEQKLWDKRWWINDQPGHVQAAFFMLGLRDVLLLKARKTWNSNYEQLANRLTEEISKRLKE